MEDVIFGFMMGSPFLLGTLALGFAGLISGKLHKKN
jgi:hypothetical protein